jgi:hypothetical protein
MHVQVAEQDLLFRQHGGVRRREYRNALTLTLLRCELGLWVAVLLRDFAHTLAGTQVPVYGEVSPDSRSAGDDYQCEQDQAAQTHRYVLSHSGDDSAAKPPGRKQSSMPLIDKTDTMPPA